MTGEIDRVNSERNERALRCYSEHGSFITRWGRSYPLMQAYVSLALEDNSEVGEVLLGRYSSSCICWELEVTSAVLLGEDLVISLPLKWKSSLRFSE